MPESSALRRPKGPLADSQRIINGEPPADGPRGYQVRDTPEHAMPQIRSISDLRNRSREISRLCHDSGEPVFITKDGEGDLVVMSLAAYERVGARLELYARLEEAEEDVRNGDRGTGVKTLRRRLGR